MSVTNEASAFTKSVLGVKVSKATGTLTDVDGVALFTVSGLVAVTSIVGLVTTAITVANSYTMIHDPTLGTSADIFAATDIGTTDTVAGEIFVVTGLKTDTLVKGALGALNFPVIMGAGQIEHNSNGTDGAITWYLTYVPIENSATVAAA